MQQGNVSLPTPPLPSLPLSLPSSLSSKLVFEGLTFIPY